MKQTMTFQHAAVGASVLENAVSFFCKYTDLLSTYYSRVLEQRVSRRQTWMLLNAQLAFFFTVFPVACPFLLRLVCLVWLVASLLQCRNGGLRTSD